MNYLQLYREISHQMGTNQLPTTKTTNKTTSVSVTRTAVGKAVYPKLEVDLFYMYSFC